MAAPGRVNVARRRLVTLRGKELNRRVATLIIVGKLAFLFLDALWNIASEKKKKPS